MESGNPKKPHVLLTNDDGIHAPGLSRLAEALAETADLTILAPDRERSAGGHSITLFREMKLKPVRQEGAFWGWGLEGTPADCVKFAIQAFSSVKPFDMVISGINQGQNAGSDIFYSGTVAAAREAALNGIPSIAISLRYDDPEQLHYETAARTASEIFAKMIGKIFPFGTLVNVNIPAVAYEDLNGWAVTNMGNSSYVDHFLAEPGMIDPERSSVLKNIGDGWNPSSVSRKNTDDQALVGRFVSITPLKFDQTDDEFISSLENWFK
jgi:5'-nucleotidase